MTRGRRRALLVLAAVLLAAAALAYAAREQDQTRTPNERPALLLLTSLPLIFGEDLSLDGGGSPALGALEKRYRVLPISVASAAELRKGRLLLMAHPLAQTPENLVALDRWVRAGGRLLLLADPTLEWASKRPLGDPLRPAPMFSDTGLLAHWGLRLDTPDERGPQQRRLAGQAVLTASSGTLHGGCAISADRFIARCSLEQGVAVVVADADWLAVDQLDGPVDDNLDALLATLADLERDSAPPQ
jgi:hypothetical protein